MRSYGEIWRLAPVTKTRVLCPVCCTAHRACVERCMTDFFEPSDANGPPPLDRSQQNSATPPDIRRSDLNHREGHVDGSRHLARWPGAGRGTHRRIPPRRLHEGYLLGSVPDRPVSTWRPRTVPCRCSGRGT